MERIDQKIRVDFQRYLVSKMFNDFVEKTTIDTEEKIHHEMSNEERDEIRRTIQSEWPNMYGDEIHKIIDDRNREDNKKIRPLIEDEYKNGEYKESEYKKPGLTGASILVLKALKVELEKQPGKEEALRWVLKALQSELIHN
jgi:hypothetical protein